MPPHCDAIDGPVVKAARKALEAGDVRLVLPYVKRDSEEEVRRLFEQVTRARSASGDAREVAERYFFESVVRLHRAGEGAAYTGLKPAGLDVGPAIPAAESALETGSGDELVSLLSGVIAEQVNDRLQRNRALVPKAGAEVQDARRYVESALDLQVWAHKVYTAATADAHEGEHAHVK